MLEPKACERCGERFGCGVADGACWCAQAAVAEGVRRELARRYRDCLCPTCLGELASGATADGTSQAATPH